MAKAVWIAGMLVGAGTAVATALPPTDVPSHEARACIESATADTSACVSGSGTTFSRATTNVQKMQVSPDLPIAPMHDAI